MPIKLIVGLSAPVKIVLGLGTLAGGGLAMYKGLQEIMESRLLGPPAWWVLWRHPLKPGLPPETDPKNVNHYTRASRVFRWEKDRWTALTPIWYAPQPPAALGGGVAGGPPADRSAYAQAVWRHATSGWRLVRVYYGRDVTKTLPGRTTIL